MTEFGLLQAESARFCIRPFLQSHNDDDLGAPSPVVYPREDQFSSALDTKQSGLSSILDGSSLQDSSSMNGYPSPMQPPQSLFAEAAQ